ALDVRADQPDTPWGRAQSLHLTLNTAEMATNLAGMSAQFELDAENAAAPWGQAKTIGLSARIGKLPADSVPATNAALGDWNKIFPYSVAWQLRAESIAAPELEVDKLTARGRWRAPELEVEKLAVELYGGTLNADAQLDVLTRAVRGGAAVTDLDAKKLDRVLGPKTMQWLGQFGWKKPPVAGARLGLTLPAWTNAQPDWAEEVLPTLWLRGALTNQAGSFRGIPFDRARLDFALSNQVWHLTDLVVDRPGGQLVGEHTSDERTHEHWWRVAGDADLKAFTPLFNDAEVERVLEDFKLTGPTHLEAELWDRAHEPDSLGAKVRVRATNFTYRGESVGEFTAAVQYTNRNLQFQNVRIVRFDGEVTVPSGSFDLPSERIYLTNVLSGIEHGAALRPIGPETARTMEPYQFAKPPRVTVNGVIPVHDITAVDLRFAVEGGAFHWERFNLPAVKADVHWHDNGLDLTNLAGVFYDGKITAHAKLDFSHPRGTAFAFVADVWESDLNKLLADLNAKTNRVEGVLNGQLIVTGGNTWDPHSWQGHGRAELRDGLLWDSPMFGFLSLPLNMIAPGLGNSRARAATATLAITNSVIYSEDLDIFTIAARLKYRGNVDFDTRVNARLEAELLRDSPVVGRVFSLLLTPLTKVFEYKVTGTLADPKPEPLYFLPRLLLIPFSPLQTLKDIFGGEEKKPEPGVPPPAAVPIPSPKGAQKP
ncbi:MAG: hypothetical protein HY301_07130, partial [Verrucomicrobia bacterium]|nr:hypothetical protein [Verrucomicrobiota bacterium]